MIETIENTPPKELNKFKKLEIERKSDSIPSILCERFQQSLKIDFGIVTTNTTNKQKFAMYNSSQNTLLITIEKFSKLDGFSIAFDSLLDDQKLTILPHSTSYGTIIWIPFDACTVKGIVHLKVCNDFVIQISVKGVSTPITVS